MSSSQERDVERGLPEAPGFASPDLRSTVTTPPPPILVYPESTRPVSPVQRSLSPPMPQRPPLTSLSSDFSTRKADGLSRFRSHLGIHNSDDLTGGRAAANLGIYQRVVSSERTAHRQYQIYSILINGALGLQIVFAAALTALGASNGPKSAVTAFGAMNTILAGFLTFLKGSGLPNRLKYYQNEWTKVREYIEQRERDFAHSVSSHEIDLFNEIATIERMYESTRRDIEANTPDSYMSLTKNSNIYNAPPPSLARNMSDYSQRAQSQLSHIQDAVHDRLSYIQNGIDSRLHNSQGYADSHLRDTRGYFGDEKAKVENQVQTSVRDVTEEADAQMRRFQDATNAQVKDMQAHVKEGEKKARELENKVLTTTEKAMGKVLGFIDHRKKQDDSH